MHAGERKDNGVLSRECVQGVGIVECEVSSVKCKVRV